MSLPALDVCVIRRKLFGGYMARCVRCGSDSLLVSSPLEVCVNCIRNHYDEVEEHINNIHTKVRKTFKLPPSPPRDHDGRECTNCINQCQIPDGGRGYCAVRENLDGRLTDGKKQDGNFSFYHDSLPTNCVADWVCPAGTYAGYPDYSYTPGPEEGYTNLAVFVHSCTFNCLFCQNWHFRYDSTKPVSHGPDAIVDNADSKTTCVCYFGGDPTSQIDYLLHASQRAQKRHKDRILRFCWETNGSMNPRYIKKIASLSLKSGGTIKFDLKAWNEDLNRALCGVSNRWTLDNFKRLASYIPQRPDPPFLVASTLLIPGYIDEDEVKNIAGFIASLDPDIPYNLLAYAPQFYMNDLPTTSQIQAERCFRAAQAAGLKKVKIGNLHLLNHVYY